MEKMDKLISRPETEQRHRSETELYATILRNELDIFESTLPFPMDACRKSSLRSRSSRNFLIMQNTDLLVVQFRAVQIYLYQLGLSEPTNVAQSSPQPQISAWRLDFICSGLISAKSLLTFYLSLRPKAELAFNNNEWVAIGFTLTIMAKLYSASTGPALSQSTTGLRRGLGMTNIINECVARIGTLLSSQVDAKGHKNVFHDFNLRIKRLKAWFEGHFAREPDLLPERISLEVDGVRATSPDYTDHLNQTDPNWAREQQLQNAQTLSTTQPLDAAFMNSLQGFQWPPDATFDEMMGDWMLSYPMGPL